MKILQNFFFKLLINKKAIHAIAYKIEKHFFFIMLLSIVTQVFNIFNLTRVNCLTHVGNEKIFSILNPFSYLIILY